MRGERQQKKRVFVGLSGGVDSSVAAALLKERGYDVTGVFIKVWQPDFLTCTWRDDRLDAMRVCAHLEIPFKTYDLEAEYKRGVVDYMLAEYKAGRTPNPDVMCNTYIKFGAFVKKAREDGADYIATGHYARLQRSDSGQFELAAAADKNKDQSYFLWGLTQDVLSYVLFPIGQHQKITVRNMAARYGLATATKKDSQGLCFLGKLDMREFLKHFVSEKPGVVLDESGAVVGQHDGALFYTLGQRHGFHITSGKRQPYFIVGKDVEQNTITVTNNPRRAHLAADYTDVMLSQACWISGVPPRPHTALFARTRYRQELHPCQLKSVEDNSAVVTFTDEKPLSPPGQSLVLYEARSPEGSFTLLGGGIIEQ